MKKKTKKEIVILSLIFIAIIACIVLLIVLKNKKTNKDEFYLSQNPIIEKPKRKSQHLKMPILLKNGIQYIKMEQFIPQFTVVLQVQYYTFFTNLPS